MTGKTYLVLSTSSYGYLLYDDETKETSFHEHRRKISFQEKKIVIGDRVTLDDAGFINQIQINFINNGMCFSRNSNGITVIFG